MSYSPTNWVDGTTPVDASNLNKLEQAVSDNAETLDGLWGGINYYSTLDSFIDAVSSAAYKPVLFTCSGSQVTSILTKGARSAMGLGIASTYNSGRTGICYIIMSATSPNTIYVGNYLNEEVASLYSFTGTSV